MLLLAPYTDCLYTVGSLSCCVCGCWEVKRRCSASRSCPALTDIRYSAACMLSTNLMYLLHLHHQNDYCVNRAQIVVHTGNPAVLSMHSLCLLHIILSMKLTL